MYFFAVASSHVAPALSAETAVLETIVKGQSEVAVTKGRLKFKSSGPVCMCGNGMSEQDLLKALAKSKQDRLVKPDAENNRSRNASKEQKP